MFWMRSLSTASPVDTVLDKEEYTLEELLDEEEIIQECKALNSRLINFLRERTQVEQLLRYVIEEPPEDADNKRTFKFPFIACEVFTCEIDVILKTLVEEVELMDLLFSFLEPNRPHSTLLAGYFSKVVVCLMLRKTVPLMNYVQTHQDVFRQLVDLIGITSIMEVLIRLVGADDHVYPNFMDVMQWLADSNLLAMIVDKLSPSCSPGVHANAAETLCTITRNASSALANKLSSPSFVTRIFDHALDDSQSKSSLVHSLSVCTALLDPKRAAFSSPLMYSFRSQHMFEPPIPVNPETITAMLPKLDDLLVLLNVSSDEKVLPTTYGELKPPLGKHRLKIVEFLAVLLKTGNEAAEKELVISGSIQRVLDLFFQYPFNNALHHHVESIILSCLESKKDVMVDHLLQECDLIGKILRLDKNPVLSAEAEQPTLPASGKQAPRVGSLGHITRISNKLVQLASVNSRIEGYLQENSEWNEWQSTVLQERNSLENVYRWACGRPTTMQDRTRDSDDDDRDYDVTALANDLSQAIGMQIYGHQEEGEELWLQDAAALDRDEEDVYFDDESAEVVISSLKLGGDQGSLFTNSNWFAFQDERISNEPVGPSSSELMEEINLNGGNSGSDDDEVVVGEDDELTESKDSVNGTSTSQTDPINISVDPIQQEASSDLGLFKFDATTNNQDSFGDEPQPEWVAWGESTHLGLSKNPFIDSEDSNLDETSHPSNDTSSHINVEPPLPNGVSTPTDSTESEKSPSAPSLFEEDVEFVGVELEGSEKAMDQALKEGIVGEAGPLKRNIIPNPENEKPGNSAGEMQEFNDTTYWRVDQDVTVLE